MALCLYEKVLISFRQLFVKLMTTLDGVFNCKLPNPPHLDTDSRLIGFFEKALLNGIISGPFLRL